MNIYNHIPRRPAPRFAPLVGLLLAAAAPPLLAQRAPAPRTTAGTGTKTRPAAATRRATPAARPAPADSALRGFQVDTLAEPIPETLAPKYPAELRAREVKGSVTAEFVVDTLGRIEPASFQVVSSDDPAFTAAVRDLIPGARFLPAINEGHLVRQVVRQTFVFDLDVLQRPKAAGGAPRR